VIIKLNIDRVLKDTAMTVCKSYLWGDTLLTSSKLYTKTFKTAAGCDSIVNLDLTILKAGDTLIRRSICEGQDVFGYKKNGRYVDTMTTLNGCDSLRILELTIVKPPRPDLGFGRKVCEDTLWLDAGDYDSYRWQDGSTSRAFGTTRPGLYTVEVSNICGKATAYAEVTPGNCDVWFPNAFSPDGNGLNDMFKVLTDLRLNDYFLQVFDRWGRKIFESRDQLLGWDGKLNGQPAASGTYVWQCSYRKSNEPLSKTKKGTVILVR
jgi:gliding motility-associated-like protein